MYPVSNVPPREKENAMMKRVLSLLLVLALCLSMLPASAYAEEIPAGGAAQMEEIPPAGQSVDGGAPVEEGKSIEEEQLAE